MTIGENSAVRATSPIRMQPWLIRAPRPEIQFGMGGILLCVFVLMFLFMVVLVALRRGGNIGSQLFSLAGICSTSVGLAFRSRRIPESELTGLRPMESDHIIEAHLRLIFQRDSRLSHPSHLKAWETLAGKLCVREIFARPVVLHWRKIDQEFGPIDTAFEPRTLDETNSGFQELFNAMVFEQSGAQASTPQYLSNFGRRISFTGNWLLLFPLGFLLLGSIIYAVEGDTFLSLFGLTMVPLMLLIIGRRIRGMAQELFVAPGSLLRRSRFDRGDQGNLHMFDRSHSALIAAQKQKGVWIMAVADPYETVSGILTDKELRVLIGAWMSPIDAPPAERLRDFE